MPSTTHGLSNSGLAAIRDEVRNRLPTGYEPLLLTFAPETLLRDDGKSLAIGDDYGTTLLLDIVTGQINSVDPAGKLPARFMNSSIKQLAASIAAYDAERARALAGSSNPARLRSDLHDLDAEAIADEEHWWAVILEQVEDELL